MRRVLLIALLLCGVGAVSSVLLWQRLGEAREALAQLTPHEIDIRFSQFMARHHEQAITLSQIMLDGSPTGMGAIARRISGAQLVELGEMRGWLRLWDEPLYPGSDDMTWMLLGQSPYDDALLQYLVDCGAAPEGMPGLATAEQIQHLRTLRGLERDVKFLELMVAHHEGGLPMARFAAREAHLPAVRFLARQMLLEQAKEVQTFKSILNAARPPSPQDEETL